MKGLLGVAIAVIVLLGCVHSGPSLTAESLKPPQKRTVNYWSPNAPPEAPRGRVAKPVELPAEPANAKPSPAAVVTPPRPAYDLPLVINIPVPEVPEKIQKPSPPIE